MGDCPATIHLSPSRELNDDEQSLLAEPQPLRNQNNYRITDTDRIGIGSLRQKCRGNLAAIELLKVREHESRQPTDEEKLVLVRYVGWGGLPQVFDSCNGAWASERNLLESLLTTEELESARATTLNAHYTAPLIVRAMYALLEQLGFKSGRILEPACGLGHLIGLMPDLMHRHSQITGVENPLINVSNPGAVRVEIEEIEEDLRDAGGLNARHRDKLTRLAELYRELRMVEKAVEVLKSASRAVGRPDAEILNRLGMFYDELGDLNRMEAHYAEAARVSGSWAGPLFNWALHHKRRRNFPVALEKVDEGILRQPDVAPYYVLRARILEGMGQTAAAKEAAQEGFRHFPPVKVQTPWQLGWFEDGAELLGRADDVKLARKMRHSQ